MEFQRQRLKRDIGALYGEETFSFVETRNPINPLHWRSVEQHSGHNYSARYLARVATSNLTRDVCSEILITSETRQSAQVSTDSLA